MADGGDEEGCPSLLAWHGKTQPLSPWPSPLQRLSGPWRAWPAGEQRAVTQESGVGKPERISQSQGEKIQPRATNGDSDRPSPGFLRPTGPARPGSRRRPSGKQCREKQREWNHGSQGGWRRGAAAARPGLFSFL